MFQRAFEAVLKLGTQGQWKWRKHCIQGQRG